LGPVSSDNELKVARNVLGPGFERHAQSLLGGEATGEENSS
jgi:hypothetical protein